MVFYREIQQSRKVMEEVKKMGRKEYAELVVRAGLGFGVAVGLTVMCVRMALWI